jgi:hypothetical protein
MHHFEAERRTKGRGNGRMIGGVVLDYNLLEVPSRYFIESLDLVKITSS